MFYRDVFAGDCGVRSAYADQLIGDKRITGGQESMPGAWPWMAALYVDGPPVFFKCGAALLSERWVITAGHCGLIANGLALAGAHTMPSRIRVRLGEHNLNAASGSEQEIIANKVIFHPKWDILTKPSSKGPKTVSIYDMMLVELKEPAKITAQVSPICLSTQSFPPGKMCHIAGWGNEKVNGPVHGTLHEAAIPVVTQQECNKPESYCGSITDDLVCAGFLQGGKDTCEGDSGGNH
ncbi:Trypsin-2 [Exaiptasia diaphana]|nr:Trypsin-2 [Exaiptasia diaphana]